jgi:hypothetical protein
MIYRSPPYSFAYCVAFHFLINCCGFNLVSNIFSKPKAVFRLGDDLRVAVCNRVPVRLSFIFKLHSTSSGYFMEGGSHYFGCKMEGLEEHMEKYLQAPHVNELYVESFLMVRACNSSNSIMIGLSNIPKHFLGVFVVID